MKDKVQQFNDKVGVRNDVLKIETQFSDTVYSIFDWNVRVQTLEIDCEQKTIFVKPVIFQKFDQTQTII